MSLNLPKLLYSITACPLVLQIKRKEKEKRKTIFNIKEKKKKRKRNNDLAVLPSHDKYIRIVQIPETQFK